MNNYEIFEALKLKGWDIKGRDLGKGINLNTESLKDFLGDIKSIILRDAYFDDNELFNLRKSLLGEIYKEESVKKPNKEAIKELYKLFFKVQEM